MVINNTTDEKYDLMSDMISIIYSFSARLYGKRKGKNKANNIVSVLEKNWYFYLIYSSKV